MRATLRTRLALTHIVLVAVSSLAVALISGVLLARTAYQKPPDQVFQTAKEQAAQAAQTDPDAPVDLEARVVRQLRDDTMASLLIASGVALAVVTVAGSAAAWWVAGRSLRPLHAIADAARDAATGDLGGRVALAGPHDEIKDLADAFDVMLARLERAFGQQQRFAAHVSHELRTPLAISRTALDLTMAKAAPTPTDLARMATEISDAIDRSERIIEGLLTLARAQREPTRDRHTIDLADAARDALNQAHLDQHAPHLTVATDLVPAAVQADPVLLAQLIANLIDNASHHNREHGYIHIQTRMQAGRALLRVTNTCPPVPPEKLASLTEPFVRGHPTPGGLHAGLGLAIAASIVEAHGGELRLTLPQHDTFNAEVALPLN